MTIPAGQLRLLRRNRGRGSGPQYGSLLLILVVTYLLSAFTVAVLVSAVQVLLFLAVVLIALRSGRFHRKTGQLIAVGLLLGSVVAAVLQLVDHSGDGAALASLWTALILLLAVYVIVRQVLSAARDHRAEHLRRSERLHDDRAALRRPVRRGMEVQPPPLVLRPRGARGHQDVPVLQLHHADHPGVRGFHGGRGRRTGVRRAGGHDRPDVPGHSGGPAGGRVPLVRAGGGPARWPSGDQARTRTLRSAAGGRGRARTGRTRTRLSHGLVPARTLQARPTRGPRPARPRPFRPGEPTAQPGTAQPGTAQPGTPPRTTRHGTTRPRTGERRALQCGAVPGEEGLGARPDPAEPARRGARAGNGPRPGRRKRAGGSGPAPAARPGAPT